MDFGLFFLILVIAFLIAFFTKAFKVVKQAEVIIIETLGKYNRTLNPGLHIIIPILEMARGVHWKEVTRDMQGNTYSIYISRDRIDLRETVYDFPRQNVITKDNVSITINALIYYQIVNPESAVYKIQNLPDAIEKLTQTTLRNIIGELDLDQTLVSRDTINQKLRIILDDATNKWGVKVNRVELQDVIPPVDIQKAMEKQMKAERDRRAAILEAEGLKRAAILNAEGQKEAEINKAEGHRQAAILNAEGAAQARILEADAEKAAISRIIEAIAGNGQPDKYLIAVRYLDTLKQMVSGENNKVIYMPFEATGVLSSIDGIKEMLDSKR